MRNTKKKSLNKQGVPQLLPIESRLLLLVDIKNEERNCMPNNLIKINLCLYISHKNITTPNFK